MGNPTLEEATALERLTDDEVLVLRDLLFFGNAGRDKTELAYSVTCKVKNAASKIERERKADDRSKA